MSLLIRGATILTLNDRHEIVEGDISIRGDRIAAIQPQIDDPHDRVIEARGGYVLPGLIQTHIHLCQTLFRGFADDLPPRGRVPAPTGGRIAYCSGRWWSANCRRVL